MLQILGAGRDSKTFLMQKATTRLVRVTCSPDGVHSWGVRSRLGCPTHMMAESAPVIVGRTTAFDATCEHLAIPTSRLRLKGPCPQGDLKMQLET